MDVVEGGKIEDWYEDDGQVDPEIISKDHGVYVALSSGWILHNECAPARGVVGSIAESTSTDQPHHQHQW